MDPLNASEDISEASDIEFNDQEAVEFVADRRIEASSRISSTFDKAIFDIQKRNMEYEIPID